MPARWSLVIVAALVGVACEGALDPPTASPPSSASGADPDEVPGGDGDGDVDVDVDGNGDGDVGAGGEGEGEGEVQGPAMCDLLRVRCAVCHASSISPDLRAAAIPALVGAASTSNPGHVLVVAGDADASFLVQKLEGTQPAGAGARMPLGRPQLSPAEIAVVRAWIDDGAPADICDVATPADPTDPAAPEPEPEPIAPGAPIVVGPPPDGFDTLPPDFAAGADCSTGQWWQFEDDEEEDFTMHPGHACIDCHARSGDDDAPRFRYAGTVMADLRDEDDCRGVAGVQVELLDINDAVFAVTTTNAAGNFGIEGGAFTSPFRARLSFQGRQREMFSHQDGDGDCMRCHTAAGENGAPGRIVAP